VKLVVWSDRALKNLGRLDTKVADRITRAVLRFADDRTGDVKKLQARSDTWRLRIGEYRVIFSEDSERVHVLVVAPRQSAYRE
jgi:mRNA interferase RelE/StbE